MGFKVLKSKNPVQWGTKPSDTSVVYMRIPGHFISHMLNIIEVTHQYYRIVDGVPYICEAMVESLSVDEFNQLVEYLLTSEEDSLNTSIMHDAFYKGALHVIAQKQKYNTTDTDWEIVYFDESDPDYSLHTTQMLM